MRRSSRSREELLLEEIEELRLESSRGIPILVEGPRDERALREIGCRGPIYRLYGKPLLEVLEEIAESHRELILMTDFDSEGDKLEKMIVRVSHQLGLRINDRFRKCLRAICRSRSVEELVYEVRRCLYGHKGWDKWLRDNWKEGSVRG